MPRIPKCAVCREEFTRQRIGQKVCSPSCAIELTKLQKAKVARKETREKKVKLRTRRKWLKLAQDEVNKYIRLRDSKDGCISCDRPATWDGQWHASHFRSVGAASAIRFNIWNIHKSCSICNNWKSGNLSDYEPRLREKIGDEKVDWLKSQNHTVTYTPEYLQRIIKIAKKKIKRLTA